MTQDFPVVALQTALAELQAGEGALLTLASLKGLVPGVSDPDVALAAETLADMGVLARGWLLQDPSGEEHELTAEDIADATEHGCLIHPETGREIENYEASLLRFYAKSEDRP